MRFSDRSMGEVRPGPNRRSQSPVSWRRGRGRSAAHGAGRRGFSLVATLVLLLTAVVGVTTTAPAGAAEADFTLTMVDGGGQLALASADEPFEMENPTTVSGTIDDVTGAMSDVAFSTPDVAFEQETSGLVANITASFSTLSASGSADGLGNVNISAAVKLDIHVDVGGGAIVTDCVSEPVNLAMVSEAPYDPDTGVVTLSDPNFSIPPVAQDGICNDLVAGPINEQLAGSGNAITLTMQGALELPPPPGDPSSVTLTADEDSTSLGAPVTFTATVEPSDATGNVVFLAGSERIGQAALDDDATASVTTSALAVGQHSITARYAGNVDYEGSVSEPLTHTVTATPVLHGTIPEYFVVGGDPVEFSATVSNPTAGAAIPNLRIDMTFGQLFRLRTDTMSLEWEDDGTWTEVPLTGSNTLEAEFPDATGFALDPGESRTFDFRIRATEDSVHGRLPVAFTLVNVDPDSDPAGEVLTTFNTVEGQSWIIPAERRPVTGVAPTVTGAVGNSTPRVGDSVQMFGSFTRGGGIPTPGATGEVEVAIDGNVIDTVEITSIGSWRIEIMAGPDSIMNDLAPGEHTVSARYLGSRVYEPGVASATFTLLPWIGERYTCTMEVPSLGSIVLAARADVSAVTPASALPGTTVPLDRLEVTYWTEGSPGFLSAFNEANGMEGGLDGELLFTGGATGTFEEFQPSDQEPGAAEGYNRVADPTGSVTIEGEPGDVIDIDYLGSTMTVPLLPDVDLPMPCLPSGDGEHVASIAVAGTVVSTTAADPVVEGTSVPLTANVYPATSKGQVAFYDGDTLIGLAVVNDGVATANVADLSVGAHQITARYSGDLVNPPSVSEPLEIAVRDAIECAEQAQPGNPATVRATYLLLLHRCADTGGFDYWVDQLDSGSSVERFASRIANSLEAHRISVDDAYQLVLDRDADTAGRNFWANRLANNGRYDVLVGDLAASNEFYDQAGGTNAGWVDLAYERILQRSPDAAGKAYWLNRLDAGESRAKIAATLVRLPEPTRTLVKEAYRAILDREPTAEELSVEVPLFQDTGSRAAIYARVIGTQEFVDNAQEYPNIGF